jgi:hypothetical protein
MRDRMPGSEQAGPSVATILVERCIGSIERRKLAMVRENLGHDIRPQAIECVRQLSPEIPMSARLARRAAAALVVLAFASPVLAYDGPVEKKTFALPSYTTVGGKTIPNARVGYESYGRLNAAGDNAIFIPHFFTATSHAAGKYQGFRRGARLLGSDHRQRPARSTTDKYFVVSADALVNLNTKDPNVVTTGPVDDRPGDQQAVRHELPGRELPRHRARAQGAARFARRQEGCTRSSGASAARSRRWSGGALYPDYVPRIVHVIGPGLRHHAVRRRDARRVDDADPDGPEVEQRRLLLAATSRSTAWRTRSRSSRSPRARTAGPSDVRLQAGRRREGPGARDGNQFAIEDADRRPGSRAHARPTRTRSSTRRRRTSSTGSPTTRSRA